MRDNDLPSMIADPVFEVPGVGRDLSAAAELRGELMGILDFTGSHQNQRAGEVRTNAVACPRDQPKALENMPFQGLLAARISARNFVRGSIVEATEGKSQHTIDGVARDVMTQL